jgi:NADPH:quinone reductase-like Zn-dependent oxidoreductase
MKAWLLKDFGLDNLVLGEAETPVPKAGELLVKVGAVSRNFRDKAIVDGIYEPHKVPKPLIPVSDAAGTVVAIGDGVSRFVIGDRRNSHLYSRWLDGMPGPDEPDYCFSSPLPGGLAEYMIIHEDSAVRAPDTVSDEEAATLPIAALIDWYALIDFGQIEAGGRIAQIGFLTGQTSALNLRPMIFRQTTIRGIAVAPRSSFDRMNEFLNEHKVRPVIDHVYPFEQARQAYEHLARGAFGKVVIKIAQD